MTQMCSSALPSWLQRVVRNGCLGCVYCACTCASTVAAEQRGPKYHGVSWRKRAGKWQVRYNEISLGYHADQLEAARVFNNAATYALDTRYAATLVNNQHKTLAAA